MCGIAGFVAGDSERVTVDEVRRMTNLIVHRGPDEEGISTWGTVGLGMRRLSIIDLSAGSQPIYNEDRSISVVFNGEIYNFCELRTELEARGHEFYTHTDTVVIVHLYEDFGLDFVKKLRGMFAIALYDQKGESLLLARDRLGKKPLYYALHKGRLYFASEIKAILAIAPDLTELDPDGILQYFYFGYISDPDSAFRHIRKLPPGHLAEYRHGAIAVRQYWDIPAYGNCDPGSDQACLEELEQRLSDAVRMRLVSDVPLGALLSGGVDSSIIVAVMARNSSAPVKTFSIGFRHASFNEAEYARMVAARFGTDHHELIIDAEINQTLGHLTAMLEEPFADSSMIPTYCVSHLARQGVTVALSGDGGDELFAGYHRYFNNWKGRYLDVIPDNVGHFYRTYLYPRLPRRTRGRRYMWSALLSSRDSYLDRIAFLPALDRERELFAHEFVRSAERRSHPFHKFECYYDE